MAQPALESFKRRGLALALRSTPNTPEIVSAAVNGVLLFNGTSGTEFDKVERPIDRPFLGGQPFAVGAKRAFVEGEFELYPPAAPGAAVDGDADCALLLLPAGMTSVKDAAAETVRYNPVSEGMAIADAKWWHAGTVLAVAGARNNITGLSIAIGDRFKGQARIQGAYDTVAEEALPTIVLPTVEPTIARAENTTTHVTVGTGDALLVWAKSLEVDLGNQIRSKEYTSHEETGISDRAPTWRLRIARTALADFNPWAVRDAGATFQAALRLIESDGRYSELGIRGQIEQIEPSDIDGDYGWELSGPCVPSDAGGDELYVEFGSA